MTRYLVEFLIGATAPVAFMGESLVRIFLGAIGLIFGMAVWFFATVLLIIVLKWVVPGFDPHVHILHCFWGALGLIILGRGIIDMLILYSVERDERNRDNS